MARTYSDTITTPAAAMAVTGKSRPFVSLLSDFGLRDASAGIMRAVVAGICPSAVVVDLAHDIDKFAVRDGALLLWSAVPYLPMVPTSPSWTPAWSTSARARHRGPARRLHRPR
jgi:hypothetical protein